MSFLSSTSSDWCDNNVESFDSANVPTSSPAAGVVPPDIRKLVCETCWSTVFSVESFQKAWAAKEPYPRFAFSYTTPKWRHILRQQRRHLIEFGRQCEWCKLISKVIKRHCRRRRPKKNNKYSLIVRFNEDYRGPDDCSFFLAIENRSGRAYVTHTAEDDPAARYIRGRDGLLDVDSGMSYDLIKKRIVECSLHEHCPPPQCARLPTRVINCFNPDQPRLFLSNGMKGYYIALSYVWGESQPNRMTTKNMDSYIDGIPLKNIPTTVMDAITVTHKLGFHYLWVDSFCIVQDSKDDKAQEIAQMRNIYHNSYVTIIAACAHKVSDGFLHDRRPTVRKLNPSEALVPFHCPDGGIGTMRISRSMSTLSEPVNDRAWCFEERVLSPRKLIYATHTLLYECQTIHNYVNGAPSIVPSYDAGKIPHLPHPIFLPASVTSDTGPSVTEMEDAWYDIIRLYTARTLTKPRDRLIAISGIAEQFHHFWPYSKYFAGLWEHQLPNSLLWCNSGFEERRSRPDRYRAPSWSWASTDGECRMAMGDDALCAIIRCDVIPARPNYLFGEVLGGSLVLETIVQPAVWNVDIYGRGDLFHVAKAPSHPPEGTELGGHDLGAVGHVRSDAIEPASQGIANVFIAFVSQIRKDRDNSAHGLVLVPVTNQITNTQQRDYPGYYVFRRVGWFATGRSTIVTAWLNDTSQRIEII